MFLEAVSKPHLRYFLAIAMLFAPLSFADVFIGNGGDGVIVNGEVLTLDLAEEPRAVYFYTSGCLEPDMENIVLKFLEDKSSREIVLGKLCSIRPHDPNFVKAFLTTMMFYEWTPVNHPLDNRRDEGRISPTFSLEQRVQLALRKGRMIQVDRMLFEKMKPLQQAALVFHEIVYAMFNYAHPGLNRGFYIRRTVRAIFKTENENPFARYPLNEYRFLPIGLEGDWNFSFVSHDVYEQDYLMKWESLR